MSDKNSVDEPLISTDIDRLIRTIADKGNISLIELREICKIDKKSLDKWISVLEDEGYISIQYKLGGTFVQWKGISSNEVENGPEVVPLDEEPKQEDLPQMKEEEPSKYATHVDQTNEDAFSKTVSDIEPPSLPPVDVSVDQSPETEEESKEDFAAIESQSETLFKDEDPMVEYAKLDDPEDVFSRHLSKKDQEKKQSPIDNIKSSILSKLNSNQEKAEVKSPVLDEEIKAEEPPSEPEPTKTPEPVAIEEDEKIKEITKPLKPIETKAATSTERIVIGSDTRELISAYVSEINNEKAHMEQLKRDRSKLYHEKISSLEGRIEADIASLSEVILDKQSKIAELKERFLELPDKVDEIQKLHDQMDKIREDGRGALESARYKSNVILSGIQNTRAEFRSRISSLDSMVKEEQARLSQLESLSNSIEERTAKMEDSISSAKSQIEAISSQLSSMQNELSESLKVKEEVDEKSTSLRDVIDNHGAELKSLENELEGISKVERLINEYVSDYEQKVREIEKYIEKSDDELVSLRESAESLYLKKYLGELETMTENYTAELEGAINAEHDIEQKIKDSKSRMIELIKVSQDLVKKLRSDTNAAAQYETLDQIVRERTAKMKSLVAEKEAERQSLIEESRGSRKSSAKSVSKSKDGPVASSVSSKSKKKKKNEEEE
ncbi:MAG: hypothetical protein ACP5N9_01570 [Candidatus Bilamarchaeum sp.]